MPNPFIPDSLANDLADKSIHFEQIRQALPSWLKDTSIARVNQLKADRVILPDPIRDASQALQQRLKHSLQLSWTAQNEVDRALGELQDVYAFARPILQQALKERFGVDDDVEQTWLRLYAPVKTSWWVHDFSGGTTSRTVSLLDAALHNFSHDETFHPDSEFISRPDTRGHFAVKRLKHKLSIDQFKSLCRELNIGARYQRHLNEFLLSSNPVASSYLRYIVIRSQKSALKVAAHMALINRDIDQQAHDAVQGMLDDPSHAQWQGQPVGYYSLSMMDTRLAGIVLIVPETASSTAPVPVMAYVPHDPEHPLKQYPSALDFMAELTRQLRDGSSSNSYQQYFSQFVAHEQRGHFFSGLNDRLSKITWQSVPPGTSLPTWRETPVAAPNLKFSVLSILADREVASERDLWGYSYQRQLNKILNDAREIAISTEYADRMARWAWWDNLEKMLSDIFNAALFVAIPFVPGLGTLMLAYTAYQLTEEVVEGVVDLAEGQVAEAAEQTLNVLESIVQLGAFAAAGAIGNVARAKLSPFFEGLKPVQTADGRTRLWNPDLGPYEKPGGSLPSGARRDGSGIYQHQDQQLLRLDDKLYEVQIDPATGQHRIRHPQRPDAYAPTLRHNGQGAWISETENPREWEGSTLMRRLGYATDSFSDTQLERIRQISGTDEAALRRVHLDNAAPPPLLTDTLQRLGAAVNSSAGLPPETAALFLEFPELPETVAEKIQAGASASERQQMTQTKRLPLRLKSQARELQFETRAVRAAQGLYHDALLNIDTERLVLGTLRTQADVFGNLRLEIREGTVDGELRCSAGPEDAAQVRVMVRHESGQYEVRDAENQQISAADNFIPALLEAMGKDGQRKLGYRPRESALFRQWLIAKTETPSERRAVLATPPIRAVAEHDTLLLVRGAFTSRGGETLQQRVQDLYSDFSDDEVESFADALIAKGNALRAIEQREDELDELRVILNRWEYQQPQTWGPGSNAFLDGGGQHIADRLIDCFERKKTGLGSRLDPDNHALDLSRELLPLDLETWWSKRPPELRKFLDKVTVLKLDNTRFSSEFTGLLKDFPNLRELSARTCEIKRLPDSIGNMHRLERLQLSDNQMVFDANAVQRLKPLTFLEILKFEDNPLAMAPDIGRMPRLKLVALKNTGLSTWPEGTLAKTRPRGFLLDLRDNPLSVIPDVVPGRPGAWVIARTRLNVGNLSESNQLRYQEIRRSVGLPPEPLVIAHPMNYGAGTGDWANVPGFGVERIASFRELSDDPQSFAFLDVLLKQERSADYEAGGPARRQLVQRIARMVDAVYIDTQLREQLYTMAIAPVDCADAGAQLFNSMGIRVLASEAYSFSTDPALLQRQLVTLAKGAARLEHVNEIARADVASRGGTPDDVEIYLAYQTGLASRLNLPWQSEGMLYRPVAGVTETMIDEAYDTVLALGEGDGLINAMLEQDFWRRYLDETWPIQIETNKQLFQSKYEKLETLPATQLKWLKSTDLEKAGLRNKLRELITDLPVAESVVFADEPISDSAFDRLLVDLGDAEKQLFRRLTRDALRKAGQLTP
ncbi:dermonecrotic toxin domain-containing protein [Pseudomonas sp. NFX15]|uniref:dermonecrotic toxin domain-containing protein n=1 Tax=Pseudomonas sp. NFX15 TaxID=2816958 RepID=UPI003B8D46FB